MLSLEPGDFPRLNCVLCRRSDRASLYHLLCASLAQKLLVDKKWHVTPQLFQLEQALAPVLPVEYPPNHEHALRTFRESLNQQTLKRASNDTRRTRTAGS
jgi:hypothetical protein